MFTYKQDEVWCTFETCITVNVKVKFAQVKNINDNAPKTKVSFMQSRTILDCIQVFDIPFNIG